jgi:hypothetical protein
VGLRVTFPGFVSAGLDQDPLNQHFDQGALVVEGQAGVQFLLQGDQLPALSLDVLGSALQLVEEAAAATDPMGAVTTTAGAARLRV